MRRYFSPVNDDGVTLHASKRKRRKRSYLPGWVGKHKTTQKLLVRKERRRVKTELDKI